MNVIAYRHGPPRVHVLAEAFAAGCRRHGIAVELRDVETFSAPERADIVWLYGLGPALPVFAAYAGRALRIVGDAGYWRDLMAPRPVGQRHIRIALDGQQPDAHLQRRPHDPARFDGLPLRVEPVRSRGEAILVAGCSTVDAARSGLDYGAWERDIVRRLRAVTARPIVVREKPKNPPLDIPGTLRWPEHKCWQAICASWAVVCRSGNVGADALLHGVPVWAERGPGAVYGLPRLEDIDRAEPPAPAARRIALADLAWWQWTPAEMSAGHLWQHLKDEGLA